MNSVKPKKHLGQHFLIDKNIALDIVNALTIEKPKHTLEVGPGMGVLTQSLLQYDPGLKVVEIDNESVNYLKNHFHLAPAHIIEKDFLKLDLDAVFDTPYAVIGNFPYNISSQIFFKILEYKDKIPLIVGMLQKEVAERLCARHGSKTYGILSVFLQVYYSTEYLFTVQEHVFDPPPKVKSGVIKVKRNERKEIGCDEKFFVKVVKGAFSTRRKTLRNALKNLNLPTEVTTMEIFDKRAEQLSVEDFIGLTNLITNLPR